MRREPKIISRCHQFKLSIVTAWTVRDVALFAAIIYVGTPELIKPHISELPLPASTMLLTYPLKPVFSCA